jgi:glycosyltransferase involved in cell wall biosynthesis
MSDRGPTLSIGLPVYNGARFLEETLESIITQSFTDFELIISDNASTDATPEICQRFSARDPRVRYFRSQENLGAAKNYNRVFELSRGRYFKWNGHDDPLAPTLLERCVAALEQDATIVLAFGGPSPINEHGLPVRLNHLTAARLNNRPGLASHDPRVRFFACVVAPAGHPVGPLFGVIRSDVLRQTALLGPYISHDLPLLAELALHGRFQQLTEVVQFRRYHSGQGHRTHRTRTERESWFDPARVTKLTFPRLRLLREHIRAIQRATSDPVLRVWCYGGTLIWFVTEVAIIRPAKATIGVPYRYLRSRRQPSGLPSAQG